uniref:Uncharacterized protein n=1 Tax=Knipowitschia caucasica TaxID=637954 RepID=A0AAV2K340_KNICA
MEEVRDDDGGGQRWRRSVMMMEEEVSDGGGEQDCGRYRDGTVNRSDTEPRHVTFEEPRTVTVTGGGGGGGGGGGAMRLSEGYSSIRSITCWGRWISWPCLELAQD